MSAKPDRAATDLNPADSDEREAAELQPYNQPAIRNAASVMTAADDDARSVRTNRLKRQSPQSLLDSVRSFWARHVVVTVPQEACRDHFGGWILSFETEWLFDQIWIWTFPPFLFHTAVSFCGP